MELILKIQVWDDDIWDKVSFVRIKIDFLIGIKDGADIDILIDYD